MERCDTLANALFQIVFGFDSDVSQECASYLGQGSFD